ncbi:pentapeptide repeat-containing protein [uncultured Roseibium sp.]|uniref:pentapeptide repeat-containing protein n=1 Tax=uncultured Roseibium sp. TaxID=1936171 RepID=UPI00261FF26D|nr:pentapeptide repeat-containing protein [uncultured Roseibium sp.]
MDESEDPAGIAATETERLNRKTHSFSFGILFFLFGIAAGFFLAFSGFDLFEVYFTHVLAGFVVLVTLIVLTGLGLYVFRGKLMASLFGIAESRLDMFAEPLSRVTQKAIDRDPEGATHAARELVQLTLARYSWITARRWIIASLTGLIASLAALAGTALLFRQNELIASQNVRIEEQTALLTQQVELAEAARNAAIAVEITRIAALLGTVMDKVATQSDGADAPTGDVAADKIPVIDPAKDLDQSLIMRIVASSQASKPYRYLDAGDDFGSVQSAIKDAMRRRREELPTSFARMARLGNWQEAPEARALVARSYSPERGQLLDTLVRSGIRSFEFLNFYGLDLSHAALRDFFFGPFSFQNGKMAYADLARGHFTEVDFQGANLENAILREARIESARFSSLEPELAVPPVVTTSQPLTSRLTGLDLTDAFLQFVWFENARLTAANFDRATLMGTDFSGADLSGSTFRGAVLGHAEFNGAILASVDFDGAYVFAEDFLDRIGEKAYPGSFKRSRFVQEASSIEAVMETYSTFSQLEAGDFKELLGSDSVWRIKRIEPFEQ